MRVQSRLAIALLLLCGHLCAQTSQRWGGQAGIGGQTGIQSSQVPVLQIRTLSLPQATIGVPYSQTIATQFGVGAVTCTLDSGSLPPGITQTGPGNCNLSGTPTNNAGPYPFVIKATDSSSPTPRTAKQPLSIDLLCTPLQYAGPTVVPVADQGSAFTFTFQTSGGIAPISCSAATGLPTDESLNSSCVLSGTPSVNGTFPNIQFTISDSCPTTTQTVPVTVSQQVNATLAITTPPTLQSGTANVFYTTQLAVAGGTPGYTYSLTSGSLPSGITLNTSTGAITGTSGAPGTYQFRITVTDSIANSAFLDFTLTIACPPLAIATNTLPNATQNQPYCFQELLSANGFGAVTWTGTLFPNGLGISGTGLICGTPTEFGNFTPQIVVTDSCPIPQTATVAPSLLVAQQAGALVWQTAPQLPDTIEGQSVNDQLVVSGGVPPYHFSKTSGTIPAGTSLSSGASAALTGTVTTAGNSSFTEQVIDSLFPTPTAITQTFSINVNCPAFSVPSQTLPPATQGTFYQFQLQSSGGFGSVSWGSLSGAPTGISLSSDGLLSGTPSASGPFTLSATVTDSCAPTPQAIPVTLPLQVNTNLAITTTALASCTVSQACSDPLSATGGTPPYTWSITSGTLQTGLSLTGANIAGTPSASGTVQLTIQVTDNVGAHVSSNFSLTVNPASSSGADNRDCAPNEIATAPPDGPAVQIKTCVRTAMADTPSNGSVVNVTAASCIALQNAVNAALCGQTVVLPPLFNGAQDIVSCNLKVANKCTSSAWLTIEGGSVGSSNFPAEGNRISPAFEGIPSLHIACPAGSIGLTTGGECGRPQYSQPATPGTYIPKVMATAANQQAITFTNASHIRVIGIDFTTPLNVNTSQVARCLTSDHIILDRIIARGGNSSNYQARNSIQAAVRNDNCQYFAVIDSYLADTHCVVNGSCSDSQGVFLGGSNTIQAGPTKVVNDFIETSGEGIFSGGGGAGINTLPAADVEVRRNDFWKPLFWFAKDPAYFGTNFEVKNCWELKNSNRMLYEGNIAQYAWAGQSDQNGTCVHLNAFNQSTGYSGAATASGSTLTVTATSANQFKSDIVAPTCGIAPGHCLITFGGVKCMAETWVSGTAITVQCVPTPIPSGCTGVHPQFSCYTVNPTATTQSTSFTAAEPGLNPSANVQNITIRYSIFRHASNGIQISNGPADFGDQSLGGSGYTGHDIVMDDIDGGRWTSGTGGSCCIWSIAIQAQNFQAAPGNLHDGSFWHITALPTFSGTQSGSNSASFWLGNQTIVGASIANWRMYDNIGPGGLWSGGGVCPSTSAQAIWNCWTPAPQKCVDNNFFAASTLTVTGATHNNAPYPVPADNLFCSYGAAKGNMAVGNTTTLAGYAQFQFTSLNGANGGNYLLQNTSPYKGLASDGKDPGADINAINAAVAGVQ